MHRWSESYDGKMSGVIAKIKEKVKGCSSSPNELPEHALTVKKMWTFIKEVLDETFTIINVVKSLLKNTRRIGCSKSYVVI